MTKEIEECALSICNELGLDENQTEQILSLSDSGKGRVGSEILLYSNGTGRREIAKALKVDYDWLNEKFREIYPKMVRGRIRINKLYQENENSKYEINQELVDIFFNIFNISPGGSITNFLEYVKQGENSRRTPKEVKRDRGEDGVRMLFKLQEKNYIKAVLRE